MTRFVFTCLADLQASFFTKELQISFPGELFYAVFRTLDLQVQHILSLQKMFGFILTVMYNIQDTLQAPRDIDLGVLIYGV